MNPSNHSEVLAKVHQADEALTKQAIDSALEAKKSWERMSWEDRACVFLKAADLLVSFHTEHKYPLLICATVWKVQSQDLRCYHARPGQEFLASW